MIEDAKSVERSINRGLIDIIPEDSFDSERLPQRTRVTSARVGPLKRHTLIRSRPLRPSTVVPSAVPGPTKDQSTQVEYADLLPSSPMFSFSEAACSTPTLKSSRDPYFVLHESLREVERLTHELSPYKEPKEEPEEPKKSVPTSRAILRQPLHAAVPLVELARPVPLVELARPVAEIAAAEAVVDVAEDVENPCGLVIPESVQLMELPDDLVLPVPVPALNPDARRGRGRGRGPPLRHSIGPADKSARRRHLAAQMKLHATRHSRQ